jgi:hypothetical protein
MRKKSDLLGPRATDRAVSQWPAAASNGQSYLTVDGQFWVQLMDDYVVNPIPSP